MRLTNKYVRNFRSGAIAVCFVFCALSGAQAQTQDLNKIWTTIGSDGTVDETDAGKVFFEGGKVQMGRPLAGNLPTSKQMKSITSQNQTAVIRYNVTPVDGLFTPPCKSEFGRDCTGRQLQLRYLATSGARVIARLIEVDLATGVETPRITFDSKSFAASNNYQVQLSELCGASRLFDFKLKAYYIEATLTGNRLIGTIAAGIQIIKIGNSNCSSID
ncbi:MAG: hypothetical protein WA584_10560 [Pyrinomonadaceae bacterium]